ncbi:domain found in IF2B/IF5 [Ancylostoma caninum]|uniref:Eukaryotic translation initiation factor 2 subunit 2 n=1 Tax=Ancylostoma caninum TaxID=29170 RepID=A0A368FFS7_ANCCA|nr:domain found in IF2B/IF5 [Ancylostoma caninum]
MADDDLELNLGKKKKTKKVIKLDDDEPAPTPETVADDLVTIFSLGIGIGITNLIDATRPWPDYTYDECLTLVFNIMREKNPELSGEKKKFAMKPPECIFQGTTGSIDGNNCLIVKGRFQQKHFESVLRKYIKEYVMCHTCRSSDTQLTKDTRLFFLQCQTCGSRCSVTAIKSGFTAMLLEVIEKGNYEEALSITKTANQEEGGCLTSVAPDLIYRVAYCFGNQNNIQLKLLLIRLFDLLTSVPQKYRLCYELLTLRTSPLLTEVLVNQLGFLINEEFLEVYPELWEQICNDLPLKLERRLCERLASVDEELWFAIVEAAHVLAFFDKIPFRVPYK